MPASRQLESAPVQASKRHTYPETSTTMMSICNICVRGNLFDIKKNGVKAECKDWSKLYIERTPQNKIIIIIK
jgi:hypothetical protein